MKVSELIEYLQTLEQEREIVIYDTYHNVCTRITGGAKGRFTISIGEISANEDLTTMGLPYNTPSGPFYFIFTDSHP